MNLNINTWNIAQKLRYGFGLMFVFIVINAAATVILHMYSTNIQDQEVQEYNPVKEHVQKMSNYITESKRLTVNWVYVDHQSGTPDKLRLAQIIDTDFKSELDEVKTKTADWEQSFRDTLALLEAKVVDYFGYQRTVMENLSTFESYDDVMALMESEMLVQNDGDVIVAEGELLNLSNVLLTICDAKCADIRDSINFSSSLQLVAVIVLSLLVIGIAILVSILLGRAIVEPLKKGVAFAEAVGNGDLTATMQVDGNDEIAQLTSSLMKMVNNFRNIVLTLERNANELVDSGEMLSTSSSKLSKGASEQAASAEEVSTAIEEMVANIDQNTENAISTEKITSSTAENVILSSQYSNEAAEAMNLISQKITIISDIAFQTNILALNAAVEAVRAGEHGRGFSVVAAEVRKLAEHSKQAASEIVTLVNKGMKVSQMAGEKAKSLVPDIEKTTILIKEIAAASMEQKTGAEQINLAMQNLNVITQENASSSDELTNVSAVLNNLSGSLKQSVGFFKLDENQQKREGTEIKLDVEEELVAQQPESEPEVEEPAAQRTHKSGTSINIENIPANALDLENYEKF